jgi:hypothetical protein
MHDYWGGGVFTLLGQNSTHTTISMSCSHSRPSAVEADRCLVSSSTACNDFIPTVCVRNMMTWGEPGTLSWTLAESEFSTGLRGEDL